MKRMVAALLILLFVTPAFGANREKRIRVGFVEQTNLMERKDDDYTGYTYEYIMKIAQYAGWQVEFVFPKSTGTNQAMTEMLRKLKKGEIDVLGDMLRTDESPFAYPSEGYGHASTTLLARQSDATLSVDTLMERQGLRIAVLKNATTRKSEVQTYCDACGIAFSFVDCADEEEIYNDLQEGRADVMVSVNLVATPGTKEVARFASRQFYLAAAKGRTDLTEQIDSAINTINYAEPHFEHNLDDKYFTAINQDYTFTKEEQRYLHDKGKLRVLVPYEIAPLQYYDSTGQYHGVFIAFCNYLEKKTGLSVELYARPDNLSISEAMASGQYDLAIGMRENYGYLTENKLIASAPLLDIGHEMFCGIDTDISDLSHLTCAVARTSPTAYPTKGKSVQYETVADCVRAVEEGRADFGYGPSLVVDYETANNFYQNIKTVPIWSDNAKYYVAFPQNAPRQLIASVNKMIESVDSAEMNAFLTDTATLDNRALLSSYIRRNPIQAALIICACIALVFSLLGFILIDRQRKAENRALLQTSRAKGDFLSRMSHEMRTPMNAIIGLTALAAEETKDPQAIDEYLHKIRSSGEYLLGIINDVLDMAKIESGAFELNLTPMSYDEFVSVIRVMVEPLCRQKQIRFVLGNPETMPTVMADKVRFRQVFLNLLSNAVKFTPSGGTVSFFIAARNIGRDTAEATFIVSDTGLGMSRAFQKHLFEPFAQQSPTAPSQGTGLGLAISKSIVDKMGGSFEIRSEQGCGTVVTVRLTLDIVPPEQTAAAAPDEGKMLAGKRVLLVEDHPLNTEIAKKLLEKQGVLVACVPNGQEALDAVTAEPAGAFDVVLMDIRMPVMDGLTAAAAIRALPREDAKTLPIIAMTANAFSEDRQKAMDAGMNDYLAKPVDPETLYNTLRKYV